MEDHWEEPWGDRRQEIVFIGTGIDWQGLKARLDTALVPATISTDLRAFRDLPDPFPGWRRMEDDE